MRVLLVPNTANAEAIAAARELATRCATKGVEPVLATGDAEACDMLHLACAPHEVGAPALAVALGGDGTMLKAFHLLGDGGTPLLGVNFGRLGFLSGASAECMHEAVDAALAGEVSIERRSTLRAEVVMDGRRVGVYRAMNEVVVARGSSGRVIGMDVAVDGHGIARLRADAMVVATATGSTAYALSAGGPIVAPGFGGMIVVPVAAHTLAVRPLLTDPEDTIEVNMSDPSRSDACVFVDGVSAPSRRLLERVVITRGEHDVALVKHEGRDFYETVATEFFGGR